MASWLSEKKEHMVDWLMLDSALGLCLLGLVTMNSFVGQDPFFVRQVIWVSLGVGAFFIARNIDWRLLRRSGVAAGLYGALLLPLIFLIIAGHATLGARSWFNLGIAAFQPTDFVNLALIILLAKYFSRRHIEIANFRHILISGIYAAVVFLLIALQPDFGAAIIVFCIWLCMVLVSGISRLHLATVFIVGIVVFAGLWNFGFKTYQKERILNFINPMADIHGTGYNAYQSIIAFGSGQLVGKGIGYGTQSKLRFLPEYQTDFIFSAFAEEWGFVGVCIVFLLFAVLFFRIIAASMVGATNFETLFGLGVFFYFFAHFVLHVGINMGILPVTGTTIPFMSYGGSHLLVEFLSLGMLSSMRRYSRAAHPEVFGKEFDGFGGV